MKLRQRIKNWIYRDSKIIVDRIEKEGWLKLSNEMRTVVDFYRFIYRIEEEIEFIDFISSITFRFTGKINLKFVEFLEDELENIFRKKALYTTSIKYGTNLHINLDSDLVL